MRVIVIGGGVGGLAAARELLSLGHRIALYEAAPVLGGQVRTFEIGGGRIESFYHHLFRSDQVVTATLDALGLGSDLEWVESRVGMLAEGHLHRFTSVLDLLRYRPVSLATRLRLGLAAVRLRRIRDGRCFEGRRARDWIVERVGEEGYVKVWEPLLRSKFGRHAGEIGMPWFWSKVTLRLASRRGRFLAREQLGYLRGSFGRMVDALEAGLRDGGAVVETGRPAHRVVVERGAVAGVIVGRRDSDDRERVLADAVLVTLANHLLIDLVPELDDAYRGRLERIRYQWATVLVLALDRPLSDLYWLTLTDPDAPFVAAVEQTNFRSAAEYGGLHVVYFSNYADPGDPRVGEDVDQVLDRYEGTIRLINPAFERGWIRGAWLFKDRAGQPIIDSGYRDVVPPHRTNVAGLYVANNTQIYPEDRGQNHTMRMAVDAARQLDAECAGGLRT